MSRRRLSDMSRSPQLSEAETRRRLREACRIVLPGFRTGPPAETFEAMARWCGDHDVRHDLYGEGAVVADFEARIAELLGMPAAVVMPSGTLAQMIAVRIWTERRGLSRFGAHPTSHLFLHEREGYQALFGLHGVPVGARHLPLIARDVESLAQPLACLLVEIPAREIGGQAPDWNSLLALKAAARARSLPLHLDGARLWECRAFYDRPHAEIVAGFESVYVSLYKGLGGLSGAVLAGEAEFIAEARLWQRRMGGNLVTQTATVVSTALLFEARLSALDACYARARGLAQALVATPGLKVNPAVPQANMLHIFFESPAEDVARRRDAIAAREHIWVVNDPQPTDVPGWSVSEVYVGDTLRDLDEASIVDMFARLLQD